MNHFPRFFSVGQFWISQKKEFYGKERNEAFYDVIVCAVHTTTNTKYRRHMKKTIIEFQFIKNVYTLMLATLNLFSFALPYL